MTSKIKRSYISITISLICLSLLAGCSFFDGRKALELPPNPKSFEKKTYSDSMACIEYCGRNYMPFGIPSGRFNYGDVIRDCIGYVGDDKNDRIYTLAQDPYDNYLMLKYVGGIMEQPQFWRACDTDKQDIFTPEYIESLDYEEWADSGCHNEMKAVTFDISIESDDVFSVGAEYRINSEITGSCGCNNADGSVFKKGEMISVEIDEFFLNNKGLENESFNIEVVFLLESDGGRSYTADGFYKGNVKPGDRISLSLRGNSSDGYKIS